jgi:hypothetical protein
MGRRTFRPRLWGYATHLMSAYLASQAVGEAIAGPHTQLLIISAGFAPLLVTQVADVGEEAGGPPTFGPRVSLS